MSDAPTGRTDRTLIVGYDPEHRGRDALRLARVLAEATGATPLVVSALPWPTYLMGVEDLDRQLEVEMRDDFARIHDELDDLGVETLALAAPGAARALHDLATAEAAEMIVLASCHRGPIGRTLLGSVGESLMSGAPCAMAVAPRGYAARDDHHLRRIAVAFDGSPESSRALEAAIELAEAVDALIAVIAVADYPQYDLGTAWSVLSVGEIRDAEHEDKDRLLKLGVERVPSAHEEGSRVLVGEAGRVLTEASADCDLMIAGSRGYGPVRRTLLGSTTRKLIAGAACPVVVVPGGADG